MSFKTKRSQRPNQIVNVFVAVDEEPLLLFLNLHCQVNDQGFGLLNYSDFVLQFFLSKVPLSLHFDNLLI